MSEFNESNYYLGTLCKHNHEYKDSGKTLRYKEAKKKEGRCVTCRKITGEKRYKHPGRLSMSKEQVFWMYVKKDSKKDDCWIWQGQKREEEGYPRIEYKGEVQSAHRYSWELHNSQSIPDDLHCLHTCDTPSCVNPYHLFLGTNMDNIQDKLTKDRQPNGVSIHTCKLTEADVKYILDLGPNQNRSITAKLFGVGSSLICRILDGTSWKHIERSFNNDNKLIRSGVRTLITYKGKTQCLTDWGNELNINHNTLKARLRYGWTVETAFTTPVTKRTYKYN